MVGDQNSRGARRSGVGEANQRLLEEREPDRAVSSEMIIPLVVDGRDDRRRRARYHPDQITVTALPQQRSDVRVAIQQQFEGTIEPAAFHRGGQVEHRL